MKRHINIPIFIPHLGCPNQCVFCNQRTISGTDSFDIGRVSEIIEDSLKTASANDEVEIAFFGGSFTGIDRDLMIELLEIAYSYVKDGRVSAIRCSTRPDYINKEILQILKKYSVSVIELGLQSISDKVLVATKRGHTHEDEIRACRMVVEEGFTLVGQMMLGLPMSTLEDELETADFIIRSGASAARIYPTVVFYDTELCSMARLGKYTPLTNEEATKRSALVLSRFIMAGVPVIRLGLCASDNLTGDDTYYAGPNHPALGELAEGELYLNIIIEKIADIKLSADNILNVTVSRGALSKAVGQKKRNKLLLKERLCVSDVRFFESDSLSEYEVSLSVN